MTVRRGRLDSKNISISFAGRRAQGPFFKRPGLRRAARLQEADDLLQELRAHLADRDYQPWLRNSFNRRSMDVATTRVVAAVL